MALGRVSLLVGILHLSDYRRHLFSWIKAQFRTGTAVIDNARRLQLVKFADRKA